MKDGPADNPFEDAADNELAEEQAPDYTNTGQRGQMCGPRVRVHAVEERDLLA